VQEIVQFVLGDFFVCYQNSVCVSGHIQLIWSLSVRSMSCLFWVICSCASRLHSDDRLCLNQVCWLVAPKTKRCQEQVKLAEREDVVWQAGKA
jgi:hypothetical protein